MKYTLDYVIRRNRNFYKDDVYIKSFALIFSIVPTWIILNYTRLSANSVTIIGFLIGILGIVGGYFFGLEYLMLGFLAFMVFDIVDGNVAIAHGGGTRLGTFLDLVADRVVLCLSILVLGQHHISIGTASELWFMLLYFVSFIMIDIVQLAFISAGFSKDPNLDHLVKRSRNDFKKIYSKPILWIPSRLSSYLFFIGSYLFFKSFIYAYLAGLLCVFGEYATMLIKHKKSFNIRA